MTGRALTIAVAVGAAALPASASAAYHLTRDVSTGGTSAKAKGCAAAKYGTYRWTGHVRSGSFSETVKWTETIKPDGRARRLRFVDLHTNQDAQFTAEQRAQIRGAVKSYIDRTTVKLVLRHGKPVALHYHGPWGSPRDVKFLPKAGC